MRLSIKKLVLLVGVVVLCVQCATVPITGRKQLLLVNEDELIAMGLTSYGDFLKENKLRETEG